MGDPSGTRQAQFRLPLWAAEFVDQRARQHGQTKTQVVVEALACLRERDLDGLMEEGYRERSPLGEQIAESTLAAGTEALDEW